MRFIRTLGAALVVWGVAASAHATQADALCAQQGLCVTMVAAVDQAALDAGDAWARLQPVKVAQMSTAAADGLSFLGSTVAFGEMRYATALAGPRFGDFARMEAPALEPRHLAAGMRGLSDSPFAGARGEELAQWASAKVSESSRAQLYALLLAVVIGVLSLSRRRELS